MTLQDQQLERAAILLVDDETRILDLFSDMLTDLGHEVSATPDPERALELVSGRKFDLVFLDQFLGPVKGTELMQRMARLDPDLYFVIVTANGSADLAVEALQQGAADFMTKPFFEDDVIRSIAYVNRKRDLDRRQKSVLVDLEMRVREKTHELIEVNFSVLTTLARAVEKKDLGTYGHSMRVSRYAERIAEHFGMPPRERDDLKTAALLHDIGKIGISDAILGKPGPLTASEAEIVRRHPENGVEILKPLKHYHPILPAILHHHEHYDGNGYPAALRGEHIPLQARIIAVADTYDAVLSDRPYRDAADHAHAFEVLRSEAGKQFDPAVVRALASFLSQGNHSAGSGRLTPGPLQNGIGDEQVIPG